MFEPSTLTPMIANCEDTRTKAAALLTGVIGQMRDFVGEAVTLRYLRMLEAESLAILDAFEPIPIAEPVFEPAVELQNAVENAPENPLDHDGDGKSGGSLKGEQSTAAKARKGADK